MQKSQPPVRAAIDIGSNTIHIVVARSTPGDLDILADEVELVRIGESVNSSGEISPEKREQALATLRQYKELAGRYRAEQVLMVATEAIREARNGSEFLEDVRRETGLTTHVISGDVEAILTFYGATYEVAKQPGAPKRLAVMDLGGGSTELVMANGNQIVWRTSIQIGSGWLHDRYLPSNPPAAGELDVARTFLQTYLQGLPIKQEPPALIVTGGSANSLLMLAHKAFHLAADTTRLSMDDLVRCEGLLSALPAEEIAQRYGQPEGRARILPAGALIIREVMARFHLDEITVSPHGIREGALLAYERYGEGWLERVNKEASQQKQQPGGPADPYNVPFARSGRQMLRERAEKMLEWHDEVLKHDDPEAVHKMRVASRRLRAILDAYESCCKPKQFKKVYREVKKLADLLGAARDTDVMLQRLHEQCEETPVEEQAGMQWLMARLEDYRQQKQQDLEAYFDQLDEQDLQRRIESCMRKGARGGGQS